MSLPLYLPCAAGIEALLAEEVRALIKQIVAAEDPTKPLSDSQISQMLDEQGIQVARRTVAKYREALKIAPTQLRKAM